MTAKQIDLLNIGLLLLSFVIAIKLPFELFLFAYAILGPLHYLTEINWLHEKDYFVFNRKWMLLLIILPFLVCISPLCNELTKLDSFAEFRHWYTDFGLFSFLYKWVTGFLFIGLISAIFFATLKNSTLIIIGVLCSALCAYFLMDIELYKLIIGVLLPTIIHVFLFTAIFMLFGAFKSKSSLGILNVVLLVILVFLISKIKITPSEYLLSDNTKANFIDSSFSVVHRGLLELLQMSNPNKGLALLSIIGIKIQIFIAFVYTYHYLNWFSKTSIIGWHKMGKKNLVLIGVLWGISICLYLYNYKLGFMALLFLSMLHVFLEFPLNIISIKSVFRHLLASKGKK